MAFEKFSQKGNKLVPQVTINKAGGINLSAGMHNKYNLDLYEGVELFYDKDDKKIGIKPVKTVNPESFKIKKQPENKGAYFIARSFLRAYSIDTTKYAGRYSPEEIDNTEFGKMFVISLDKKLS